MTHPSDVVLTPHNDDLVVATITHTPPDRLSDPERLHETLTARFHVRTDWLSGTANARDTVTLRVSIHTERRTGPRRDHIVIPTVEWTRQHLEVGAPVRVRWWAEAPETFPTRAAAAAGAEALVVALTRDPLWLRAIDDTTAPLTLAGALGAAARYRGSW